MVSLFMVPITEISNLSIAIIIIIKRETSLATPSLVDGVAELALR
jgi:hypothetical protein